MGVEASVPRPKSKGSKMNLNIEQFYLNEDETTQWRTQARALKEKYVDGLDAVSFSFLQKDG
jgi:hypothetical protein